MRAALAERPHTGVLIAPNFSIGAVLLMRFAQQAARFYESVEVVELHHPDKVDAPSGTATRTAQLIAAARADGRAGRRRRTRRRSDPLRRPRRRRSTGSTCTRCACAGWSRTRRSCSARPGEQLTLRHDSFDRASFMPGVLAGGPGGRRAARA